MAIDILFGLVKEGNTEFARREVPAYLMRARCGISPSAIATSRHSGSKPSRQITMAQFFRAAYLRPFALIGLSIILGSVLYQLVHIKLYALAVLENIFRGRSVLNNDIRNY